MIQGGLRPKAQDPEPLRRARLLKAFLWLMLVVFGTTDLLLDLSGPGRVIPWYGYAFVLMALALNHFGLYRIAALTTLAMFPFVNLASVLTGSDPRLIFTTLIIGIIAASLLLDRRAAVAFDIGCFVFLVLTPWIIPEHVPNLRTIMGALILVAIGGGLSIILMIHRDEVERDRQTALRASEERLRLALDASHMGTWEWDAVSRNARWSERVEALLGLPDAFDGTSAAYFRSVHPEDRPSVEKTIEEVISGRLTDFEIVHRVVWPDGPIRWVQVQGRSTPGSGEARRVNGTILDITDRKLAEAERDELIQELERKNAELERFTYTVSHDLKSPLITIRGFLGSIDKDLKDNRFDRLSVDVERIFNATTRMQRLLDELLNLSRIGRISNPPERVAFADLTREAMAMVRGRLDAAHVRMEIRDDLPDVFGDRSRLVQVLQNLLDNSAKFLGDQKSPRIVVGSRPSASDGRPVFYVQDNGIGVDPKDLDKILGLFEKLDDRNEGTGVGLAIVKRIIEVHGGKLWVESLGRGHGTTVCFTLPTRGPV